MKESFLSCLCGSEPCILAAPSSNNFLSCLCGSEHAEAEGMLECVGMFSEREYIQIAEQIGSEINDLKPFFVQLWQSIYGPDSWSLNPWVWVIEFKVAQVGEE